jgi:hypothetical protein
LLKARLWVAIRGCYRELEHQRAPASPPSTAALRLGDLLRVRQLLEVRLTTFILDEASWHTYENGSRRADEAHDAAAVRLALLWDAN